MEVHMLARLGNVILWIMCALAALILYAAISGKVQPDMVVYWWVAAAVFGLIGMAARYVLTGDR
jgi:hypothetical protein